MLFVLWLMHGPRPVGGRDDEEEEEEAEEVVD